jgi:hypothetical protein
VARLARNWRAAGSVRFPARFQLVATTTL